MLAARLKAVLPSVISIVGKGFLKERFIGENTRLVYDIMEYLNTKEQAGILLLTP